uniref:Uncharacterized protein n=1 Tax=Anguilla anguilla TaxID=7936 RepID=A0A0E9W5U7_ANGAN
MSCRDLHLCVRMYLSCLGGVSVQRVFGRVGVLFWEREGGFECFPVSVLRRCSICD